MIIVCRSLCVTVSFRQVPVSSWFDDMTDSELLDLIPFLETLSHVDSVYSVLRGCSPHPAPPLQQQQQQPTNNNTTDDNNIITSVSPPSQQIAAHDQENNTSWTTVPWVAVVFEAYKQTSLVDMFATTEITIV